MPDMERQGVDWIEATLPDASGRDRGPRWDVVGARAPTADGPAGDATRHGDPLAALFAAILVDDEVDPFVALPRSVQLDFTGEELAACFQLSHRLWQAWFDRGQLLGIVGAVLRGGGLGGAGQVRLKHVRATCKHLRYAHALYGAGHRYPRLLDAVTVTMGDIQDACRNRRPLVAMREAALLRVLLARWPAARLRIEAGRLAPATPASFRALLAGDARAMREAIAREVVTGHEFHELRKRIGRQVSFWDTLRTLAPTEDRFRMSRALSAINGLMGDVHDGLVRRRAVERTSYGRAFALPAPIRSRIAGLLPCYPAAAPPANR